MGFIIGGMMGFAAGFLFCFYSKKAREKADSILPNKGVDKQE